MKKTISLIMLVLVMVMALAACGGSSALPQSDGTQEGAGTEAATSTSGETVSGETYDVGTFMVGVPSGWMVLLQEDYTAEPDSEGNYPTDKTAIGLVKDGKTELDCLTNPTVYVYYHDSVSAEEQYHSDAMWYDETIDMELTIGDTECMGFEARTESLLDEGQFYVYQVVYYPVTDSSCFQIIVPVNMIDFPGVTLFDLDVQYIISGISVK